MSPVINIVNGRAFFPDDMGGPVCGVTVLFAEDIDEREAATRIINSFGSGGFITFYNDRKNLRYQLEKAAAVEEKQPVTGTGLRGAGQYCDLNRSIHFVPPEVIDQLKLKVVLLAFMFALIIKMVEVLNG